MMMGGYQNSVLMMLTISLWITVVVSSSSSSSSSARWLLRSDQTTNALFSRSSTQRHNLLMKVRGGAILSDDESSDEEDSDFDFDSDDDDDELMSMMLDDEDGDMMDDAFDGDSSMTQWIEAWKKTPPFTKAYLSASIGATLLGYLSSPQKEFPAYFMLNWKMVLTRGQIWRPLTAFLNFGTMGIGYLLTLNFVWTYMSTLERLNHDHPYDFWYMIFFGCMSMVAGYSFLGLSPKFLGHNLSTFLVYIWSRYHEGLEVNMFELFNTRAEMLPWFFLAQTFLLEGEFPILDLLGIFFGHVYHYLKHTSKALITPRFLVDWYHNHPGPFSTAIRKKYAEISSDYEMQ